MTTSKVHQSYQLINLILAGIVLCIFIYSGLFSFQGTSHPLPSLFTKLTGEPSISTGLSRSFSAILQGNLDQARQFNPYGPGIFLFFFFQLIFRITLYMVIKVKKPSINILIFSDIALSLLTFLLAFKEMIIFTLKLFHSLLVNL